MRTKLVCNRYFPDPPGIVSAVVVEAQTKAPLAKGGCLGTAEAGGFHRVSVFHMGLFFQEVPTVNPSVAFGASSLWQGSLCGQCPQPISHGNLQQIVTAPPVPGIGGLPKPPLPKGGASACRGGGIPWTRPRTYSLFTIHSSLKMPFPFPHGFVLWWSANCESLSHASGVPAPFSKGAILRPVSLLCRRLGFIPPDRREVAWGAAPRRREPAGAKAIGRPEAVPPQVCQVFGFDHTKASCKIGTGNR